MGEERLLISLLTNVENSSWVLDWGRNHDLLHAHVKIGLQSLPSEIDTSAFEDKLHPRCSIFPLELG